MLLRILRQKHNYDFIKYRPLHVGLAVAAIIISFALLFVRGLNYGIDFKGGMLLEVKTAPGVTIHDIRTKTGELRLTSYSLQEFGSPDILLVRMDKDENQSPEQVLALVKNKYGAMVSEYRRVETVGPVVGGELKRSALWAILAGIGMIFVYVWFRFEWQFALGGMLALFHDVIVAAGFFSLTGIEFNLVSVAALLTIAGYSINDTVVIYDRLRENLRRFHKMSLNDMMNLSINETLSRTLLTSVTTLVSMLALALFGGSAIQDFGLVMVIGILVGTYSSIALALPIVAYFSPRRGALGEGGGNGYAELFTKGKQ